MNGKKILIGLVMLMVILSGTTVLFFTDVEKLGVTPATAAPPPDNDCHLSGGFCAEWLGTSGGCAARPCCPPGQTYCWQASHRITYLFQELGSPPPGSLGTCWKYDGSMAPWCEIDWCDGGPSICSPLCKPAGTGGTTGRDKAVPLEASCLPYY